MRKFVVGLLLSLHSIGNIMFPHVELASLRDLYQHCEAEDHDINIPDFVFEHLLNVPDFFEFLENDDKDEEERPHTPIQHMASSSVIVVEITRPITFECKPQFIDKISIAYPIPNDDDLPIGCLSEIFHPPSV